MYQIESDLPAWLLLRDFFTKGEYDEKEKSFNCFNYNGVHFSYRNSIYKCRNKNI